MAARRRRISRGSRPELRDLAPIRGSAEFRIASARRFIETLAACRVISFLHTHRCRPSTISAAGEPGGDGAPARLTHLPPALRYAINGPVFYGNSPKLFDSRHCDGTTDRLV